MNSILFTAVFFYIRWIVEVAVEGRPADCCLKVKNTQVAVENIVSYDIQEAPPCNIEAVRFYTKYKKVICSDPTSAWAKSVIEKLRPEPPICPIKEKIQSAREKTTKINILTSMSTTETTIKTSQLETSMSTTIETSTPKTSRSTTVTTIQTSQLRTDNSIASTQQPKKNSQTSQNTATTCEPPKETETQNQVTTGTTSARRTNPSRLKVKILKKKGRKALRKHQMGKK